MQMLRALVYLHGIVQNKLKPDNILFCKGDSDELRVIDFRLSKTILDTSAFLKSRIGTSYYIAPEVLYHNYSEKSDVWICGDILDIMLVRFALCVGKID
jgi:calcium-dependent protein kinase